MTELIRYDAACRALAEATKVDEVKKIRDVSMAMKAYARQAKNRALEMDAAEIRLRAERRLGELLIQQKEGEGLRGGARDVAKREKLRGAVKELRSDIPTLSQAGIDKKLSSRSQQLAKIPAGEFASLLNDWKEENLDESKSVSNPLRKAIADLNRSKRRKKLKRMAWPEGKYRVLYADPPWPYRDARLSSVEGGGATGTYETLSLAAIHKMPVKKLALDEAVLFLWITSPLLPDGLSTMTAWGFEYKASFVWDKVRGFNGHYNDVRHELLLVGTRGNCLPETDKLPDSVLEIEKTGHSRKPEEFRSLIDRLYPSGPRIELFARKKTDNWNVWGNEIK